MTRSWVGVDIDKLKFDVAIIFEDKRKFHKVFENNSKGFTEFNKWLESLKVLNPHICLEATGIYGQELAYFMHKHAHKISIINPTRIKAYAASEVYAIRLTRLMHTLLQDFVKLKILKRGHLHLIIDMSRKVSIVV